MDLATTYLGLKLPHPFMPGASPLVDDLDTVKRLEDAGARALDRIAAHRAPARAAGIEAHDPAIVVLVEVERALTARPAEVRPHRLERDVEVPLDRVLVGDDADVEGRVALLDVGLHDEAVAVLERGLAEPARDEGEEPGHEVRAAVVELAPGLREPGELAIGRRARDVVRADAVAEPPGVFLRVNRNPDLFASSRVLQQAVATFS